MGIVVYYYTYYSLVRSGVFVFKSHALHVHICAPVAAAYISGDIINRAQLASPRGATLADRVRLHRAGQSRCGWGLLPARPPAPLQSTPT